jgi:hypothetical protein
MNENRNNEIDETLKKMLKDYGEDTPRREPEAAKHTRERFLAEIDNLGLGTSASRPTHATSSTILMGLVASLNQLKENLAMSVKQRSAMTIVSTILVLVMFLFGGGGLTAYAASAAIPGDALYPVKTGIENARAGLTGSPEGQANLFLGFAGKRLDEIQTLIAEGRYADIDRTAAQFEMNIQKALDAIRKLSETNPARAAELSTAGVKILKSYSSSLNALLTKAPGDVQPVIQGALNASQAAELENNNDNNVNDNSNGNNDNGNLNDNNNGNDDNSNLNDNNNGNDDNSNLNDNNNGNDDNSNLNDNNNGNDDNSNLNDNNNGNDDNSNLNDNRNGNDDNSNLNDNNNGNDDNSNLNDNSNGNINDNGNGDNSQGG